VAQLIGHPTLGFSSGHDLGVMGSSPSSGSTLSAQSLLVPLPLLLPQLTHTLSLFLLFSEVGLRMVSSGLLGLGFGDSQELMKFMMKGSKC